MVVQIETDKVTIDVRYTESAPGKIKEFLVKPEDTVTVGQEVAVIDKGAGDTGGGGEPCVLFTQLSPAEILCSDQGVQLERAMFLSDICSCRY